MKPLYETVVLFSFIGMAATAHAGGLIYRGNNANITPGAAPYSQGAIEKQANLSRPKEKVAAATTVSTADSLKTNFLNTFYSQIITGAEPTGSFTFSDHSYISFADNVGTGQRIVTFHNNDGSSTQFEFPIPVSR